MRRSQMAEERTYTVRIHNQGDEGLWAEVEELPGCFASGLGEDELAEALEEAIGPVSYTHLTLPTIYSV